MSNTKSSIEEKLSQDPKVHTYNPTDSLRISPVITTARKEQCASNLSTRERDEEHDDSGCGSDNGWNYPSVPRQDTRDVMLYRHTHQIPFGT